MRDILLTAIVLSGCVAAFKRPWIGVMLWTWLSIMNPHRYAFGFSRNAPLAALAVGCTVIGLLMMRERLSPFKGKPIIWFAILIGWITISWLMGLDVSGDYYQWKKVMKIDGMLLVTLMLLHSRKHIIAFMWVSAGSLALLGIKGGIFTLRGGAGEKVWGPPGSFIADNNEFALALVMTIPLVRFLQLQVQNRILRFSLLATMILCAASALGSQSRGALLAIAAMAVTLWWRGKKNKLKVGFLVLISALPLLAFMPETWTARMATIGEYQEDGSAMGRINAWWAAWNIAMRYPFGAGFNPATRSLFAQFAPEPDSIHAAHSIYFQMLGNHGFVGLAIFIGMGISTWRMAGWLRSQKNLSPATQWTADLGAMCQVSLVAYMVGGAFLSLAYFDLPYNVMAMVVLTRIWVERQSWQTESSESPRWMTVLGLVLPRKVV